MSRVAFHRSQPHPTRQLFDLCRDRNSNPATAELLLADNAININAPYRSNSGKYHYYIIQAASCGHFAMVNMLIRHRADIHVRDGSGNTALEMAARARGGDGQEKFLARIAFTPHERVVTELFLAGASPAEIRSAKEVSGGASAMYDHIVKIESRVKGVHTGRLVKAAETQLPDEVMSQVYGYLRIPRDFKGVWRAKEDNEQPPGEPLGRSGR